MSLRAAAIRAVATATYRTGAIRPLVAAASRAAGAASFSVLTFHRVNDDGDPFLPALPTRVFEGWVSHIARHYCVLTVEDLAERAARGRVPVNALALTFDDGYRDNLTHAAPILVRHGLTATVFVTTGFIGTGEIPWFDRLAMAIRSTAKNAVVLPGGGTAPLASVGDRLRAVEAVLGRLKRLPDEERRARLEDVIDHLGAPGAGERKSAMLSWDDVHALRGLGLSVGAHTVSHPILARMSAAKAWEEIHGSKTAIERALGAPVRGFAYPNGGPDDYTPETAALVREAGFACAVTTRRGLNSPETPPFELRRGGPWESHLPTFALKLAYYRLRGA